MPNPGPPMMDTDNYTPVPHRCATPEPMASGAKPERARGLAND